MGIYERAGLTATSAYYKASTKTRNTKTVQKHDNKTETKQNECGRKRQNKKVRG
jgi:outer membrane protease